MRGKVPLISVQTLVDQVFDAIVSEIVSGELPSNSRLIQDELARAYGVSRHPVQQALLLLRSQGLVKDAPGRGLIVSPLDVRLVNNLYEVRASLEGLAARLAAEQGAKRAAVEGPAYIAAGRAALKSGPLHDRIDKDIEFHIFISELSGNSLIGEMTKPHWSYLRRVLAECLPHYEDMQRNVWDEHAAILNAVIQGKGKEAEKLGREHVIRAKSIMVERLQAQQEASKSNGRRVIVRR